MFQWLYGFIPHWVGNAVVAGVWDLMRRWQRLFRKDYSGHTQRNGEAFLRHKDRIARDQGYVEDQNSYTDMAYGESTMQYSGCEIFAVYNAIYSITGDHPIPLPGMIAEFERDGMVWKGKFGTSPKALKDFLDRYGFRTEYATKEKMFDALGERCQSLILSMYNDRDDIRREIHTVNISGRKGQYVAHNVYCNGRTVGPCGSVQELMAQMNGGRVKGICLLGVSLPDGSRA